MDRKIIIVDLDGTVANCDHRLKYILDMKTRDRLPSKQRRYDKFFQNCIADTPITHVIDYLKDFEMKGVQLVFVTGRPEKMRVETQEWILKHFDYKNINDFHLAMRNDDDYRVDGICKFELVEKIMGRILMNIDTFDILFAIDDRQSVIDIYEKNGIICIDVNKLDI